MKYLTSDYARHLLSLPKAEYTNSTISLADAASADPQLNNIEARGDDDAYHNLQLSSLANPWQPPRLTPLGTLAKLPLELREMIYLHLHNNRIFVSRSGIPKLLSTTYAKHLRSTSKAIKDEVDGFALVSPAIFAKATFFFDHMTGYANFMLQCTASERSQIRRIHLKIFGIYLSRHQYVCLNDFSQDPLRIPVLVEKKWRKCFRDLPPNIVSVDVHLDCGEHSTKRRSIVLEVPHGCRRRKVGFELFGRLEKYDLDVLDRCVRQVMSDKVTTGKEEWVLVEGSGQKRVEELKRVNGDGGFWWEEVFVETNDGDLKEIF